LGCSSAPLPFFYCLHFALSRPGRIASFLDIFFSFILRALPLFLLIDGALLFSFFNLVHAFLFFSFWRGHRTFLAFFPFSPIQMASLRSFFQASACSKDLFVFFLLVLSFFLSPLFFLDRDSFFPVLVFFPRKIFVFFFVHSVNVHGSPFLNDSMSPLTPTAFFFELGFPPFRNQRNIFFFLVYGVDYLPPPMFSAPPLGAGFFFSWCFCDFPLSRQDINLLPPGNSPSVILSSLFRGPPRNVRHLFLPFLSAELVSFFFPKSFFLFHTFAIELPSFFRSEDAFPDPSRNLVWIEVSVFPSFPLLPWGGVTLFPAQCLLDGVMISVRFPMLTLTFFFLFLFLRSWIKWF